ncbi:MAG: TRAP transporter fused permease subunit [Alphaproteobacteria bacterium]|jgi:TRAP transporter 4TM/12TM fusion protein|tara:strand:+ start:21724 stop:24105 length:2382 start_codon:yes stop_codon:yes gene_type:complete
MKKTYSLDASLTVAEDLVSRETSDINIIGFWNKPISILLISWSLFQLYISSSLGSTIYYYAGFGLINDIYARSIHLFFGGVLCFLIFPFNKNNLKERSVPLYDIILALIIAAGCLWQAFFFADIIGLNGQTRSFIIFGLNIHFEFILGWISIFVVLEAARRSVGLPLAIIGFTFVIYTLFNQYLPEPFGLSSVSFTRYVTTQWFGQEGIFGIPLGVSTKTIFLFVLFGALLNKGGAGKWFIDLAFASVGHMRGGPAKSAVLASGLTGMISGSSIANTVTTGTFTIPIMKKNGYPAVKAGAIEVASSVNGQLMPPIMGAAAFVMAEVIGIPYFDIIKHAFIPAFISYIALFYIVHLEALKLGLKPVPILENVKAVLSRGWQYLIPIIVLVLMLTVFRFSADRSALYCIITLIIVFFVEELIKKYKENNISIIRNSLANTTKIVASGLKYGAQNMVTVSIAVAAAGLVMGSIGASGLSNAIQEVLTAVAGDAIIPILFATAILSIILGMGLPTTANYLIVSTLMVGIVSTLGRQAGYDFPIIAIHMFCFYFGLMADVTPPVGLASYAAASISRADPIKTGVQAFLYSGRTAILPFVFMFNPELLLINVNSWIEGILIFLMSLIAIISFTAVTLNWFKIKLKFYESLLLLIACCILFRPGFLLDNFYQDEFVGININEMSNGINSNKISIKTIDLLDNEQTIIINSPNENTMEFNWDNLGIKAMPSFLYQDAIQVSISKFNGIGYQSGLQNGMNILSVSTHLDRISKYWFYIPGLVIFIGVYYMQTVRSRITKGIS